MAPDPLPLFPLRTVLFPGAILPLRIFEARYLDMVSRCLRTDGVFGVVAIRHGSEAGPTEPFLVGTLARIVDWDATSGGLLGIKVRGDRRFRYGRLERAADGLYLGHDVTELADSGASDRECYSWARQLLKGLTARGGSGHEQGGEALADARRVCWNLAARLPLDLEARQALLETDSLEARFERLRVAAREFSARLRKERRSQ